LATAVYSQLETGLIINKGLTPIVPTSAVPTTQSQKRSRLAPFHIRKIRDCNMTELNGSTIYGLGKSVVKSMRTYKALAEALAICTTEPFNEKMERYK
jgi:hypothetical protein